MQTTLLMRNNLITRLLDRRRQALDEGDVSTVNEILEGIREYGVGQYRYRELDHLLKDDRDVFPEFSDSEILEMYN